MTISALWPAMLLALTAVTPDGGAATKPDKRTLESAGSKRTYYLYTPQAVALSTSAPLLVLFHGSGQNGLGVLREWTGLADREGIYLVAPDALDTLYWQIKRDGPMFVRDVIESVADRHPIDRRRVYLFGLSGGAVHALTLAMLQSEYFASTAIFAGAWREEEYFAALSAARRKIPVSIIVGDRDEFFPLESVKTTERALREAGHPVMLKVLRRRGHAYRSVADIVNREAWGFMKSTALNTDPVFQSYDAS